LHKKSRYIIVGAALLLLTMYFLPLWQISLEAPQYPEGLGFYIYINNIDGQHPRDLDKINNLNHYIGMKKIEPESIPELELMPWIVGMLVVVGIAAGASGRKSWLLTWILLSFLVSLVGFYDYYQWGYDYGHNLDTENAIIKIPGMSYQPPLIGSKKLLNFTAVSLPGIGGWIAILAYMISSIVFLVEWRSKRRKK